MCIQSEWYQATSKMISIENFMIMHLPTAAHIRRHIVQIGAAAAAHLENETGRAENSKGYASFLLAHVHAMNLSTGAHPAAKPISSCFACNLLRFECLARMMRVLMKYQTATQYGIWICLRYGRRQDISTLRNIHNTSMVPPALQLVTNIHAMVLNTSTCNVNGILPENTRISE